MASGTITASRTNVIAGDEAAVRQAVARAVTANKGKIEAEQPDLTAKFGSQWWLRLVGGFFISSSKFPVRAQVSFAPADGGTRVDVQVADAMGVGMKAGMKTKYQKAVDDVAAALSQPSS